MNKQRIWILVGCGAGAIVCVLWAISVAYSATASAVAAGANPLTTTTFDGWVQLIISLAGTLGLGGTAAWQALQASFEAHASKIITTIVPGASNQTVKNVVDVTKVVALLKIQNDLPAGSPERLAVSQALRTLCDALRDSLVSP